MSGMMDQLMQLKAMTVRTGAIHEAQALQLRNYPLLIEGVKQASVRIDVERKMVEYKITKYERGFPKSKSALVVELNDSLKKWVQTLLWPDTVVVVKQSGRVIYDSRS